MASLDEERYLRYLWLLGEGGLFVLRGVISRETTKSGSTLDNLLQNGRAQFKGVLQKQRDCLFPTTTTVNADTYTWDMSILFVVLKKLFRSGLSLIERADLSTLKTYRDDFQGHPPIMSMNASDYLSNRQRLEQALRQLASGINGKVEIESIIKRTATGRIDSDSIFTHIREIYDFKTSFLTAVEDMLQHVNSKFSSVQGNEELILQKLTDLQIKHFRKTKHKYSRELRIIIQAECDTEEKQRKANDLLFEFVELIHRDTAIRSDEIKRIITQRVEWYGEITLQLLDDLIEWFSDIEDLSDGVGKPRLGSIILPISCSSVTGILTLLKYMNGDQSKQCLSRISSTISVSLGFPCLLSWKVEPMSLTSALPTSLLSPGKGKRSKEVKNLVLPINAINIEQLTDICKMFGEAERSSNMEKISTSLSKIFGETISLKTNVDNDQLRSIVNEKGYTESQPDKLIDGQSSDVKDKKRTQKKLSSSDSGEGYTESQPDKLIDGQSSDVKDKKRTQKKLSSSDSGEDLLSMTDEMSELLDFSRKEDFSRREEVNWVMSILALKITADEAMTYLARSIFKQFFDSLTPSEKNNLQNLLDIAQNRCKVYKLRRVEEPLVWEVNAPECRSLLKKLVSAHWKPANLEWDNIGDSNVESYWKIAKLYMPRGNKKSTSPKDTDMHAILNLLRNFKLENFAKERNAIDQMIRHRNNLCHSPDTTISEKEMTEIFTNINTFMDSTTLDEDIKSKTKNKLQQVQLISNEDKWHLYKEVLPVQITGFAVDLDRTEQFLSITKRLLFVFENAMKRKYVDYLPRNWRESLAEVDLVMACVICFVGMGVYYLWRHKLTH
ncbi:uncharacterized protein LOC132743254 [Ruditapes philippinarum]|uniref:uncharacterized protein LOC132743254 n=1 Tax=Ruditapes philippinarum TaxID=129788 RepID=UPI00295AD389|nr:uncharacterized protein LOC132743254 [Ruditapes philippinarum]